MISATSMTFGSDIGTNNLSKQVNVVFDNGPKMVSLSIDNSCGQMAHMARADIRLLFSDPLKGGVEDVTFAVFGSNMRDRSDIVCGTIENMDKAMKWLQMANWGFGQ
tara:strand:+ start:262 stop:582 length:321 start_codon:yes stop_codon:yes gene_type:complete